MTYKEALETCKRSSSNAAAANTATGKTAIANVADNNTNMIPSNRSANPRLPGTLFNVSIPSGTTVNFHNLVEMSSPRGMSVNLRLPFLGDFAANAFKNFTPLGLADAFRAAGGTIEVMN